MESRIKIAEHLAPKNYLKFKRWHKAACALDNLTAAERWVKMGNKLPEKDDSSRTKKKK